MSRIRTTLEIEYNNEVRDLKITFDLIDRVRGVLPWEQLAVEFEKDEPVPNFTMMARFVYLNLKAAGFAVTDDDLMSIYDEIISSDERASYIQLVGSLLQAYMPQGGKKKVIPAPATKPKRKARTTQKTS
jgi:hypothetical protein